LMSEALHTVSRTKLLTALAMLVLVLAGGTGFGVWWVAAQPSVEPPRVPAKAAIQADTPVLVVVDAVYPGANARTVADTVAFWIEQRVKGVEGLVRIESTSDNDGQYTGRFYFRATTDPASAVVLVQNRVVLAEPALPDMVRREGVTAKVGK